MNRRHRNPLPKLSMPFILHPASYSILNPVVVDSVLAGKNKNASLAVFAEASDDHLITMLLKRDGM